jgi:hypothetical protein
VFGVCPLCLFRTLSPKFVRSFVIKKEHAKNKRVLMMSKKQKKEKKSMPTYKKGGLVDSAGTWAWALFDSVSEVCRLV